MKFAILSQEKALEKSKRFLHFARKMATHFKSIEVDLLQSRSELNLDQHIAISIYDGIKTGIMFFILMIAFGIILSIPLLWKSSFLLAPMASLMMFYTKLVGPKVIVKKRARLIDSELPYALRHLLIEVKSGIP